MCFSYPATLNCKFRISEFDFVVFRSANFSTCVDREIFTLKIICAKRICVDKFSQFVQSAKFVLTVDGYKMDKCLEHS